MKRSDSLVITIIGCMVILLTFSLNLNAQAPSSFSYQAILRDAGGDPIASQPVSIRIYLHQGSVTGLVVYCETHATTTSPLGLVNLSIGQGTVLTGSFPDIPWETGQYFLELELDPAGGTTYVSMGTTQLVSVPYALYSEKTTQTYSAGTGIEITDATISNTAPDQEVIVYAGDGINVTGVYPEFTVSNTLPDQTVGLYNGTGINVTGAYPDFTIFNTAPDQAVSLTAGTGIATGGIYPDFTVTNTAPDQVISLTGSTGISTSGSYPFFTVTNTATNANHTGDATGSGALTVVQIQGRPLSATAPAADQVLQWNGSQWGPATLSSASPGWSLTGNGGTNPAVNFFGTTDNQPLRFKVNNQPAGEINPVNDNTFIGKQAGGNSTGGSNVAVGSGALFSNVARSGTTALGYQAMYNASNSDFEQLTYNTAVGYQAFRGGVTLSDNTGKDNTAIGSMTLWKNTSGDRNTAIGYYTLNNNTSGDYNTVGGVDALWENTTGSQNTAFGYAALSNNTTRSDLVAIGDNALYHNGLGVYEEQHATENTAIGSKALYSNTTGYFNTASGYRALYSNTTGWKNTAIGDSALYSNTIGLWNTAIGSSALYLNTTGDNNTASGVRALKNNTDGNYNTASGFAALYYNTTGDNNTANGAYALFWNTEGNNNTASGYYSLQNNTTGSNNTASGCQALKVNQSGAGNTASGSQALLSNLTGYDNTASGFGALYKNTDGYQNAASGSNALYNNTHGYNNTASGFKALYNNTTGDYNAALGTFALFINEVGDYNTGVGFDAGDDHTYTKGTFLGASAKSYADGYTNCTALGYGALVKASNQVVIGNDAVTSIGGYAGWTNFSDGRFKKNVCEDVPGLEFINQLRPITYTLDVISLNTDLNKNRPTTLREGERPRVESPEDRAGIEAKEKIEYTGFIAQEVEQAARNIGYNFSGVDAPQNPDGHYGLRYAEFVVPLVKAVQEQQAMIENQQRTIESQQQAIEALQKEMKQLSGENDPH